MNLLLERRCVMRTPDSTPASVKPGAMNGVQSIRINPPSSKVGTVVSAGDQGVKVAVELPIVSDGFIPADVVDDSSTSDYAARAAARVRACQRSELLTAGIRPALSGVSETRNRPIREQGEVSHAPVPHRHTYTGNPEGDGWDRQHASAVHIRPLCTSASRFTAGPSDRSARCALNHANHEENHEALLRTRCMQPGRRNCSLGQAEAGPLV